MVWPWFCCRINRHSLSLFVAFPFPCRRCSVYKAFLSSAAVGSGALWRSLAPSSSPIPVNCQPVASQPSARFQVGSLVRFNLKQKTLSIAPTRRQQQQHLQFYKSYFIDVMWIIVDAANVNESSAFRGSTR